MNPAIALEHTDKILDLIADQLVEHGYVILDQQIDTQLLTLLRHRALSLSEEHWLDAGIGREQRFQLDKKVRSDKIHWLNTSNSVEAAYLTLMANLKQGINRRLFMGLYDFESHFSIYQQGQFYNKHIDALKGRSNRVLSTVLYLNEDWQEDDAGQLLLYNQEGSKVIETVAPKLGTMIIFLSEKFPHQVLAANCRRYSIAGWYRVNANQSGFIDPAE